VLKVYIIKLRCEIEGELSMVARREAKSVLDLTNTSGVRFWTTGTLPMKLNLSLKPGSFFPHSPWVGEMKDPGNDVFHCVVISGLFQFHSFYACQLNAMFPATFVCVCAPWINLVEPSAENDGVLAKIMRCGTSFLVFCSGSNCMKISWKHQSRSITTACCVVVKKSFA